MRPFLFAVPGLFIAGIFCFSILYAFPDGNTGAMLMAPATVFKDSSCLVEIKITKGNLDGFARVEIQLPEKLSAQPVITRQSMCEADEHTIKYIWMQLPKENEFSVSFRLSQAGNLYKSVSLNGHFAYVENNQRKMVPVVPAAINFSSLPVAQPEHDNHDAVKQAVEVKTPERDIKAPEPEVYFSVQIASSSIKYPENYFKSKGIPDKIKIEPANGRYKYLVGEYGDYPSAVRRKEEIWSMNRIAGAFIVAYKGGTRVPVAEVVNLKK